MCDDACRIDECLQDNGDCDSEGCQDDICSQMYQGWLVFVGSEYHKLNHTIFCKEKAPLLISVLRLNGFGGLEDDIDNCDDILDTYDFNKDNYINFREAVVIISSLGNSADEKSKQLNCSTCTGMQYYNI